MAPGIWIGSLSQFVISVEAADTILSSRPGATRWLAFSRGGFFPPGFGFTIDHFVLRMAYVMWIGLPSRLRNVSMFIPLVLVFAGEFRRF
jgi:hypothetical protein